MKRGGSPGSGALLPPNKKIQRWPRRPPASGGANHRFEWRKRLRPGSYLVPSQKTSRWPRRPPASGGANHRFEWRKRLRPGSYLVPSQKTSRWPRRPPASGGANHRFERHQRLRPGSHLVPSQKMLAVASKRCRQPIHHRSRRIANTAAHRAVSVKDQSAWGGGHLRQKIGHLVKVRKSQDRRAGSSRVPPSVQNGGGSRPRSARDGPPA